MLPNAVIEAATLKELRDLAGRDPHAAYDAAASLLEKHPDEIALNQIQAVALLQTGSLRTANAVLGRLYAEGHRDPETLGLLGSSSKREAELAFTAAEREAAWLRAHDYYLEGLLRAEERGDPEGYYPGINAAALALLLRDEASASSLAGRAATLADRAARQNYWSIATKAEAALIQRDVAKARHLYQLANSNRSNYSQVATTRRQARRIASALSLDPSVLDDCLHVPPVLIFVGHLTDHPGRAVPRFPEAMTSEVAGRIKAAITRSGAALGLSSAARGGDLLFLESLQACGIEQRVVLPLERDVFCSTSVGDAAWEERYRRALAQARSVHIANSHSSTADGSAFEYGTRILLGLARLHARRLDTEVKAIVLWDGQPGDGHGGTAWSIGHLLECGVPIENTHPAKAGPITTATLPPAEQSVSSRPIRAMLFADCKGYSKLREEQVAEFTIAFLSGVARLVEQLGHRGCAPIVANTWGDGLFMAFEDVRAAGVFALALREGVLRRAEELGVPEGVAVRIGLHAGPVTPFLDPITRRQNFAGQNVAFAARIEPIALENQVCVSEAFAALASENPSSDFSFEYLGVTAFAKGFGQYPLFQLYLKTPNAAE